MVATVLDPRYKRPCFLTEEQKKTAYDEVKSHMDLIIMSGSESDTPQEPNVHIKKEPETCTNIKLVEHSSALHFIMGEITKARNSANSTMHI